MEVSWLLCLHPPTIFLSSSIRSSIISLLSFIFTENCSPFLPVFSVVSANVGWLKSLDQAPLKCHLGLCVIFSFLPHREGVTKVGSNSAKSLLTALPGCHFEMESLTKGGGVKPLQQQPSPNKATIFSEEKSLFSFQQKGPAQLCPFLSLLYSSISHQSLWIHIRISGLGPGI